ncbi:class I SAM-dependent methyltransferase [Rhodovibrionaceae bacterium A322]
MHRNEEERAGVAGTLFEENSIFTNFYDQISNPVASLSGERTFYETLCRQESVTRLLDAGCGTGRLTRQLAKPDLAISAFDASAFFIEKFRHLLRQTPPAGPIELSQARFDSFQAPHSFDLCILGYYGLSYVLCSDERRRSLANLARLVRPGGSLVVHLPSHSLLTREVPELEIKAMTSRQTVGEVSVDGSLQPLVLLQQVDGFVFDRQKNSTEVTFTTQLTTAGQTRLKQQHRMIYAAIDQKEMAEHAKACGLELIQLHNGFCPDVRSEEIYQFVRLET